ncbi:MAG: hypothetical protein JWO58_3355 [Chitinophagaceae bacterium]|nr:hypothetical protein [Chitinophagaceae bacterium]
MSLSAKLNDVLGWRWEHEPTPQPLHLAGMLPHAFGIYELGLMTHDERNDSDASGTPSHMTFVPQYVGRAAEVDLRERLLQHWHASHNLHVRIHANQLWFRYRVLQHAASSSALGAYLEGISLALDYPFNPCNRWRQHWALET